MSRAEQGGLSGLLNDYRQYAGARLWAALALMLAASIAEGFGILLLVPLAAIAIGGAGQPQILAVVGPLLGSISPNEKLALVLAAFVAAMAARSILIFARDIELGRLEAGYEASLRIRAASTLASRGWVFASSVGQAGMQSLLLTDIPRVAIAVRYAQQLLVALVLLSVQFILAALLSPTLAAVALLIVVAGWILAAPTVRKGIASGIAMVDRSEDMAGSGFRLHAGLKSALAQGTVPQFLGEYESALERTKAELVTFSADLARTRQLGAFGAGLAAAAVLFVGIRVLALPFPLLAAALVLFARMATPAQQVQQFANQAAAFAQSFAAIGRRLGELGSSTALHGQERPLDWKELRLEDVAFEHRPDVGLKSASLVLSNGEWIGVGGASGAGKTTLVDLIAGLIEPQSGTLTVDGRPLADEVVERWRAGLAYVGQEGAVFDDSVRGNLLAEGATADEAELWRALELTGLAARIRLFPSGLDEKVGDRGSQLSGGERQRLTIARALLRKPSLLILDEATSALDAESEQAILDRIRRLAERPAAIVVAHRASTLAHCDSVAEIRHGRLEKGAEASRSGR